MVDTPVWVDHLSQGDDRLVRLLENQQVLVHPFIIGELALGNLRGKDLDALNRLPHAIAASHREVMDMIEARALAGRGFGYVDAHLLAATLLTPGALLWTRDQRLRAAAELFATSAHHLD